MKGTILLIAVVVANELSNRGYPVFAVVLMIVAIGEAFLFEWIEHAVQRLRGWKSAFLGHYEQATGMYKRVLTVLVGIVGLSVAMGLAAIVIYAAWLLGVFPAK